MRKSDIEKVGSVILASGIATRTQREAIVQRIRDWYEEQKSLTHATNYGKKGSQNALDRS